ncbi:nitrous oxide reductase family maturation protein NosD [candidate division KSB1 bacterium]|nr:nitrous oxide reductase family maturation protein NosD [candidate division KSB1 bacterium]NIS25278.1 nitrous oxide reductase family maturation protein NosD [candidate division KSB1 bacterium]NIT72182.1 nitrous oxide reductase family maturation protein NosD [candidate division KSB1 bacterium]NIU26000.1 nitrous oxide reductase family maturation protein NosD [candidate division KSB1 bacterium]NIU94743.1 nitrous oxide reductase family maturation protein NosD [candidate division KSB1 bacterium]
MTFLKAKHIGISSIILCTILLQFFAPKASPKTYKIMPGTSLQQTIDNAGRGDTLLVESGVYEPIILRKQLVLLGNGMPEIVGPDTGRVVQVFADSCEIRGFRICGSGISLQKEHGGIYLRSNGNIIAENRLDDVLFGIYFYSSDYNQINDNVIEGKPELAQGRRGSGMHLWYSFHNEIFGNEVQLVRDGMYIQHSNVNDIHHNRMHNLRYGLHYMFSDTNSFAYNHFYDNVAGAALMYSKNLIFKRNIFEQNRGVSSLGILFKDCDFCLSEENIIAANATGIFIDNSSKNIFRRNTVSFNDLALKIFSSANYNLFYENNFMFNMSPLEIVGRRTTTKWASEGRGNYWTSYQGFDLNHDGIADHPYKIQNLFDYIEGNYPALRLFSFSPASQAIAAGQVVMPIFDITFEEDPAPLMRPIDLRELRQQITGSSSDGGFQMFSLFVLAGVCGLLLTVKGKISKK